MILFLLLLLWFFLVCGRFLLFTISHTKKVNKPFVVLRGVRGTSKIRQALISRKMQPPLSGHPGSTGRWPLNGGWPLNRGSS